MDYFNDISGEEFDLKQIKPPQSKSASDFCNLSNLLSLFRYRSIERNLTGAKEFNYNVVEKEMKFEDSFFSCSIELYKAVHNHCFYIMINNFVKKINECKDSAIKKVLTKLCIMFACTHMLDENWSETLGKDQYRLIRECAYTVMNDIRPDAIPLVNAFDIPDNVLRSAIGRYDGNIYEALFYSAQKSILNEIDPFLGYEEYLIPHLNKELLKKGNVAIKSLGKPKA